MKRIILIGLLMVLATGFHSCTEDEFLEPTTVDLKIKMVNPKPFEELENLPPQANKSHLELEGGTFQVTNIDFEGNRENYDNYYFSTQFDSVLVANLSENKMNQEVSFDIPRGRYEPIKITLHTRKSGNIPGLKLKGKFQRRQGIPGPINGNDKEETEIEFSFFDYKDAETIELKIETEEGDRQILFDNDNWDTLEIRIDLAKLFRGFGFNNFNEMEVSQQGGKRKIIISEEHNMRIHSSLAERVERSIKAVVK